MTESPLPPLSIVTRFCIRSLTLVDVGRSAAVNRASSRTLSLPASSTTSSTTTSATASRCVHVPACVCACTCVSPCLSVCARVCAHVCVCARMCVHVYAPVCVPVCVHAPVCVRSPGRVSILLLPQYDCVLFLPIPMSPLTEQVNSHSNSGQAHYSDIPDNDCNPR